MKQKKMAATKNFSLLIFVIILFTSCVAQKASIINRFDAAGKDQPLEDSILNNLRNENDIVIAYAIENFAWVKKIGYKIIAQKDGKWQGYDYTVNLMRTDASRSIGPAKINEAVCDSLAAYLTQTNAWKIKGDSGTNFCTNGSTNCNINDAASERLWIITKKTVMNPSYYAPEFYEQCCPDINRALFLSVKKKIESCITSSEQTTDM